MSCFSFQKLPAVTFSLALALSAVLSVAHAQHSDKEVKEDIQDKYISIQFNPNIIYKYIIIKV